MRIPLPRLLRTLRRKQVEARLAPARQRWALGAWSMLASRPRVYRAVTAVAMRALKLASRDRGAFRYLPLAGAWTRGRDLPAPRGETFMRQWRRRGGS